MSATNVNRSVSAFPQLPGLFDTLYSRVQDEQAFGLRIYRVSLAILIHSQNGLRANFSDTTELKGRDNLTVEKFKLSTCQLMGDCSKLLKQLQQLIGPVSLVCKVEVQGHFQQSSEKKAVSFEESIDTWLYFFAKEGKHVRRAKSKGSN